MNLTIERDILAVALSRVTPLIGRSTIPILGCLKITATPGQIEINGQNGTAAVSQTASASVHEPGELCVAADKFSALVNSLPRGSQLELETTEQRLTVCYGKGRATFATDDPASFPIMHSTEGNPFTIPVSELRRLLTMVLPMASDEETRPYLKGVYLHGDEAVIKAVTTDGNALCLGVSQTPAAFAGIILPSVSVASLIRILAGAEGDASVWVSESSFAITVGSCSFQTKLVDGTFPPYDRVIPARIENPIMIEAGVLEEVTRRAQAVTEAADASKSHPRSIRLKAEGEILHIEAGNEAEQRIDEDIEIEAVEGAREIILGTAYVLDAVAALGGEGLLALHVTTMDKPARLTREGNDAELVVLMGRRF